MVTEIALREISLAKKKGHYTEFDIIDSTNFEISGRLTSRVDVYLLRENLALYSLVFVTESNGELIKARITMPDNATNRKEARWQKFVEKKFSEIIISRNH